MHNFAAVTSCVLVHGVLIKKFKSFRDFFNDIMLSSPGLASIAWCRASLRVSQQCASYDVY
jgi:hypothetical protein